MASNMRAILRKWGWLPTYCMKIDQYAIACDAVQRAAGKIKKINKTFQKRRINLKNCFIHSWRVFRNKLCQKSCGNLVEKKTLWNFYWGCKWQKYRCGHLYVVDEHKPIFFKSEILNCWLSWPPSNIATWCDCATVLTQRTSSLQSKKAAKWTL